MHKMKLFLVVMLAMTLVAQGMDMRGLKKRNKAYLEGSKQTQHVEFNEDAHMLNHGKVSRRHLSSLDLEVTPENVAAAHARQLKYFNETKWDEADPWVDPAVGAVSPCPGLELYGSWGTSYICPGQVQKDCATDALEYANMNDKGDPIPAEGNWNIFPTAMRGNWDDPDYWTIPFPMGKVIGDYENMCESGEVFNKIAHPACIPRGVEYPYATLCVFNRVYRLDYNALWYAWYAWAEYADSAEVITRSATIETDGMGSTTALYQARIFVPTMPDADTTKRRRGLRQDVESAEVTDGVRILATAAKGGDIESLQNMLNTDDAAGLGASPSLVYPPPTPSAPWAPSGNSTNSTVA